MKKYFLILLGDFKSEEFCKDVALTITPLVDSPQLKFQHSNGALIFHFASEVDQTEMYEFLSVSFFENFEEICQANIHRGQPFT